MGNIVSNLTEKRSKAKVIEKLCALDLVVDRKDLYKKRTRKPRNPWESGEDDMPVIDDWSDESGGEGPAKGRSSDGKATSEIFNTYLPYKAGLICLRFIYEISFGMFALFYAFLAYDPFV